ncbi:hypothetical protein JCM5350_001135 [Sporobolomyces pararoseus]
MSQYYTQYEDYESPTSGRLDQPLASTSIDENGYHFFPHSSSSVYDDPEESKLLSSGYRAEPYSSPTPSSSGGRTASSVQRRPSSYAINTSQYSQPLPFFGESRPPPPNFISPHFAASSIPPPSPSLPPPALSHPAVTSDPSIIRPNPQRAIRAMPMPVQRQPSARKEQQIPQTRSYSSSSASASYPIPANGNLSRRRDIKLRPDAEAVGARWQLDQGTNETSNRIVEMNDERHEEAHYMLGDGHESTEVPLSRKPRPAQFNGQTNLNIPSRVAPQVQYYDDLIPQEDGNRSFGQKASSSNRVQKRGIKLVPVSQLPDTFRSIWRFGVFNAVQSHCFGSVYCADENVVVSAPTGAGKTVLFELAIIRVLMNSNSNQSKVLYMAPTKSLCAERANDWKKKFDSGIGWKVVELTGDSEIGSTVWREVASSRIIVTTPEKWDAMTRRWHDHDRILSELQLFCVDEVHSVGTDVRGAVLEVVVSRMKTLGTSTRFIAVSATVPNIKDVADWLRNASNEEPAQVFEFGDEFRPCPLQKIVYGYNKNNNDFAFAKTLNLELFRVIKKHSSGNPVLIFCSTRKGCSEAAEQLVKDYKESLSSQTNRQSLAWPKPPRASYSINDKKLATLVENGVSIHHAGMDINDRKLVEKLFLDGKISVICSTSTLAVGVNLPARMVIIRGTKAYIDGRTIDYPDMDILQMLGRAGRPQFDRSGVAVIMTERESQQRYENLVNAQKNLESCLHKNLTEHINSEITLRTITDVDTALRWLRSTFLYVRISKNSAFYAIAKGSKLSPDARLEEICVEAVKQLVSEGIVIENEDQTLAPNDYGDIMSRYYISHSTFVTLKSMPHGANMRSLLESVAKAEEFSSFRLRVGEKSVLAKVNKMIRFPIEKVATTADRIMVLLQVILEGITGPEIKTENVNPLLEINSIWPSAIRVAKAIFDLAILRKDGSARLAMELLRSLNGKCWDGSSFVLRQLKGIGEKGYKALVDAGIRSFADVAAAPPDRLELILHRKPPYGSTLVSMATTFPKFKIDLSIEHEQVRDEGVEVEIKVGLDLEKTQPAPITKKGIMNLYASLLMLTSDNHFIEYRRCPLSEVAKGSIKPFSVSVILIKPSQRVVVSVSCDLLAGSEVRAEVKPSTKASDFPIPSLASEPEENLEEFRAPSTSLKGISKPFTIPKSTSQKRSANEVEEKAQSSAPRMLENGKYACNHNCRDKKKCKHLCCREGTDKPPRPPAAKKKKLSNSRSNSVDTSTASASTSKSQSRIPMKSSSGVFLAQDPSGKIVTRTKSSGKTGFSSTSIAKPEQPTSTTRTADKEEEEEEDDIEVDDFDLPSPDQLFTDLYSKSKLKKKGKKVVFSEPSPSPAPSPTRSRTASPDSLPSSSAPTFVKKAKPSIPSFGKSTLALTKKSKVSLKEFDSSDEEVGLDFEPVKSVALNEKGKSKEEEPLFRKDSFELSDDPIDNSFSSPDEVDYISNEREVFGRVGESGTMEVDDEFGDLDLDLASAVAQSYEPSARDRENIEKGAVGGMVERDEKIGDDDDDLMKVLEVEEGKREEVGGLIEDVAGDEEKDEFDDWLAENVIIKD